MRFVLFGWWTERLTILEVDGRWMTLGWENLICASGKKWINLQFSIVIYLICHWLKVKIIQIQGKLNIWFPIQDQFLVVSSAYFKHLSGESSSSLKSPRRSSAHHHCVEPAKVLSQSKVQGRCLRLPTILPTLVSIIIILSIIIVLCKMTKRNAEIPWCFESGP